MKISKYTSCKMHTNAIINGDYYVCENTEHNRKVLKNALMPAKVIEGNKIIFPYFG